MKLSELGLKSKPQTKYFDGGYVSFSTLFGDLSFGIHQVTKQSNSIACVDKITSNAQLERLSRVKNIEEAILSVYEVQA